jgi:hypothetical protein
MDGYDAAVRIARTRPDYIPLIRKCVAAHQRGERQTYWLGFEWDDADIMVWPITLARMATEHSLLEIAYKSRSARCYKVRDIEGVGKALQDIDSGRIVISSSKPRIPLKLWLSEPTTSRLKSYIARELPYQWDAEALVVERALNAFLDGISP